MELAEEEWRKSATLGDRDNKAAERKGRMKGWTLKNKPDASSGEPNNTQSQAWRPPCGCICLEDFGKWRAVWVDECIQGEQRCIPMGKRRRGTRGAMDAAVNKSLAFCTNTFERDGRGAQFSLVLVRFSSIHPPSIFPFNPSLPPTARIIPGKGALCDPCPPAGLCVAYLAPISSVSILFSLVLWSCPWLLSHSALRPDLLTDYIVIHTLSLHALSILLCPYPL